MFCEQLLRRLVFERGVDSVPIVEGLDVFEDGPPRIGFSVENAVRRKGFPLERGEERLAGGITDC